jgi:hypothetical protein
VVPGGRGQTLCVIRHGVGMRIVRSTSSNTTTPRDPSEIYHDLATSDTTITYSMGMRVTGIELRHPCLATNIAMLPSRRSQTVEASEFFVFKTTACPLQAIMITSRPVSPGKHRPSVLVVWFSVLYGFICKYIFTGIQNNKSVTF